MPVTKLQFNTDDLIRVVDLINLVPDDVKDRIILALPPPERIKVVQSFRNLEQIANTLRSASKVHGVQVKQQRKSGLII